MRRSEERALSDSSEALRMLHFAVAYAGGFTPVYIDEAGRPGSWIKDRDRFVRVVRRLAEREHEPQAGSPTPSPQTFASQSCVLWANIEGTEQERLAKRFRPVPSIVLRIAGTTKRLLLWCLSDPVDAGTVERVNKRIAYALRARQNHSALGDLRLWLPGTLHRNGRPRPIEVTRLTLNDFNAGRLAERLREPPRPWSPRRARAEA
jgi:hypothetical protein